MLGSSLELPFADHFLSCDQVAQVQAGALSFTFAGCLE